MSAFVPPPSEHLPPNLVPLYEEAGAVADVSPASACALLRIVMRSMLQQRGMRGRHLTRDIEGLVEQGAPVGLLRAMDVIAMAEDEARRPAELNLANGHTDAQNLVMFVNLLADQAR